MYFNKKRKITFAIFVIISVMLTQLAVLSAFAKEAPETTGEISVDLVSTPEGSNEGAAIDSGDASDEELTLDHEESSEGVTEDSDDVSDGESVLGSEESTEDVTEDSDDVSDGESVLGSEESPEDVTEDSDNASDGESALSLEESGGDVTEDSDESIDEGVALDSEAESLLNTRAVTYGDGKYQSPPPESEIDMTQLFNIVPGSNSKIDSQYSNVVLITGASTNQSGGIFSKLRIDLEEDFHFEGALYIGPGDFNANSGADGMTFVLHNDSRGMNAIGAAGESLGAYNTRKDSKYTAIQNAIAVEFDIYHNNGTSDRSDRGLQSRPHMAFVVPAEMTGTGSWSGGPLHQNVTYVDDMYSPNWRPISITWLTDYTGGGWLLVNLDGIDTGWRTDDYLSHFGSNEVYWGFTGATGAQRAVQALAITEISSEPDIEVSKDVYLNHDFYQSHDGKSVEPDSILTYQISAMNQSEDSVSDIEYVDNLPDYVDYIEGTADLVDNNGNVVESSINVSYNKDTNSLSYQSNRSIGGGETLSLRFDVKVKGDVDVGVEISNTASVVASKFTFHSNTVANTVEGRLDFVSAPTKIDFGSDLKISSKEEVYQLSSKEGELIVQDSRGTGNTWSISAKLMTELRSESGHELLNSLYYMRNGQEKPFSTEVTTPIYEAVTENSEPVVISSMWGSSEGEKTGPVLKIRPGQARSESYSGKIQWTLQTVPENE